MIITNDDNFKLIIQKISNKNNPIDQEIPCNKANSDDTIIKCNHENTLYYIQIDNKQWLLCLLLLIELLYSNLQMMDKEHRNQQDLRKKLLLMLLQLFLMSMPL